MLPGEFNERELHQLGDQFTGAPRRIFAHEGKFLVGAAHGGEGHARDAACTADTARHQRVKTQTTLKQRRLGQHHDQVLYAFGVVNCVSVGGVVNSPGAGCNPGLAPKLLDARASLHWGNNFEVARFAGAHHVMGAHDSVSVGFKLGENDFAGVAGGHVAVKKSITVKIGFQAVKVFPYPLSPERRPFAWGDLVRGDEGVGSHSGPAKGFVIIFRLWAERLALGLV